ncbi:MAG: DUF4389 domain-containing protein [bacterium]
MPSTRSPEPGNLGNNLRESSSWARILHMLILGFAYSLAEVVIIGIAVAQAALLLATGRVNEPMKDLGKQVSRYAYAIFLFLTFNTEEKPFPFQGWDEQKPVLENEPQQPFDRPL